MLKANYSLLSSLYLGHEPLHPETGRAFLGFGKDKTYYPNILRYKSTMLEPVIVILLLATADGSHRVVRKAGDQPSEGSCMEFNFGGDSGVHWYNCCNNCINGRPVDDCDQITWQSVSTTSYCGSCGSDTQRGNGNMRGTQFKCGGCSRQKIIRKECSSFWKEIPGFCWVFSKCFQETCQKTHSIVKRSVITNQTPDTCYNNVCDAGETPDNCPTDCCYKRNPSCAWNNTCVSPCCGEIGCCGTSVSPRNLAETDPILELSSYLFYVCILVFLIRILKLSSYPFYVCILVFLIITIRHLFKKKKYFISIRQKI
ncbi:uncharacterized protein LOC110447715 isoform X2 [Mizuhopecten yessoensis]|uniref:uncharacterized protein LOC110447715 isoform X2 n=1 Tax=Mizuhopecten yessoensis TaxID=6573 RepID=UPI000B457194|nr:uncharacterized protein LOC110447715 isoform X2 [Mizuhopecten yessoensis]